MFYKKSMVFLLTITLLTALSFPVNAAQANLPSSPVTWRDAVPSLNPLMNALKIWNVACKTANWHLASAELDAAYRIYKSYTTTGTGPDVWVSAETNPFITKAKIALEVNSNHKILDNQSLELVKSYIDGRFNAEMKVRDVAKQLKSQGKLDSTLKEAFPNKNLRDLKDILADPQRDMPDFTTEELQRLDNLTGQNAKTIEQLLDKSQLKADTADPKWLEKLSENIYNWYGSSNKALQKAFEKDVNPYFGWDEERWIRIKTHGNDYGWESKYYKEALKISKYYYGLRVKLDAEYNRLLKMSWDLYCQKLEPQKIELALNNQFDNYFYPEIASDIINNDINCQLETLNEVADNIIHTNNEHTDISKEYVKNTTADLKNDINNLKKQKNEIQNEVQTTQADISKQKITNTVKSLQDYNVYTTRTTYTRNLGTFGGGQNQYFSKTDIEVNNFLKPDAKYEAVKNLQQTTQINDLFNKLTNATNYNDQLSIYNQIEALKNTNQALKEYVDLRLLKIQIANEYAQGATEPSLQFKNLEEYFNLRSKQIKDQEALEQGKIQNLINEIKDADSNINALENKIKDLPTSQVVTSSFFPAERPDYKPIPGYLSKPKTQTPVNATPPMINPLTPVQPAGPICH